jgi:hypothetical protein
MTLTNLTDEPTGSERWTPYVNLWLPPLVRDELGLTAQRTATTGGEVVTAAWEWAKPDSYVEFTSPEGKRRAAPAARPPARLRPGTAPAPPWPAEDDERVPFKVHLPAGLVKQVQALEKFTKRGFASLFLQAYRRSRPLVRSAGGPGSPPLSGVQEVEPASGPPPRPVVQAPVVFRAAHRVNALSSLDGRVLVGEVRQIRDVQQRTQLIAFGEREHQVDWALEFPSFVHGLEVWAPGRVVVRLGGGLPTMVYDVDPEDRRAPRRSATQLHRACSVFCIDDRAFIGLFGDRLWELDGFGRVRWEHLLPASLTQKKRLEGLAVNRSYVFLRWGDAVRLVERWGTGTKRVALAIENPSSVAATDELALVPNHRGLHFVDLCSGQSIRTLKVMPDHDAEPMKVRRFGEKLLVRTSIHSAVVDIAEGRVDAVFQHPVAGPVWLTERGLYAACGEAVHFAALDAWSVPSG